MLSGRWDESQRVHPVPNRAEASTVSSTIGSVWWLFA
jgi:hypothetical protein